MFVASSLYNYATGAPSTSATPDATPANTRVKRRPLKQGPRSDPTAPPRSPPPAYASVAAAPGDAAPVPPGAWTPAELAKVQIVDAIVQEEDLYKVLGVSRKAKADEIRRGFLARSRVCHPDKFPSYPACIPAFQRVSLAYQTLSSPSSRRMYDVSGRADFAQAMGSGGMGDAMAGGDETLNGVLYSVFCEFLDGDFEMIRVLVNAMNEGNPGLNLGEEAVDSIEGAFKRLRHMMLAGKKYLSIIRFELIRLYEIQHSLRQLSYFDVFGRLRLTLQLARVTLSIPMAIDSAMKAPDESTGTADAAAAASSVPLPQSESEASSGSDADEHAEAAHSSDFGVAPEETEDSDEDGGAGRSAAARRAAQRERRRIKRRERRRAARVEGPDGGVADDTQAQLQKRGLLGPTASRLLGGVVQALELTERWVPGQRRDSD
ncbi:hypothetical protein FA09DRAFT_342997 [Tilletiopsis washingtonensis]|uniref:J domain-containing protein n=1 Tax=Tilletiopsis washingtonensis TaxID=58919 RepID=A0A316ZCS1_9BASI|nr:hypothetical protein FA09DRAFT_342997 [Tilletiopsis washingtonensis]PWN98732.1 hypothetical protein FA09DRAFT_342997 [Tilletiopsis washingtonensis]